jgi:hypothetical protein
MTTIIILEALKTFIKTYSGIGANGVVLADYLSGKPNEFAISPQPGNKIVEKYINGGSVRQFSFALQMTVFTADEAVRITNNGFYEGISDWFESQTLAGTLPTLNTNQHPTLIEALSQPALFQQGESETGIYSMQCRLEYDQDP